MKTGLFIGRFQPFHNGHAAVIAQMLNEVDKIIIGIGTPQLHHTFHNPLTIGERKDMIRWEFKNAIDDGRITCVPIADIYDAENWVNHVESLVSEFQVVYTNNNIVENLFKDKGYEVKNITDTPDISSTRIRDMMIKRKSDWVDYVPLKIGFFLVKMKISTRLRDIYAKYLRPAVTCDTIIKHKDGIVFIKRKNEPFKNFWALPGGFMEAGKENAEECAIREVREETSLKITNPKLFGVYSAINRDPRGVTISIVFTAKKYLGTLCARDDAKDIKVFKKIPKKLAFDHRKILEDYFNEKP